jgi:PKD repeat protein
MKKTLSLSTCLFCTLFLIPACQKDKTDPLPVASFTASKTSALVNEAITFNNTSQHSLSYAWNFDDGTTSTLTSPSHSFTDAGTYTVELTATGPGGIHSTSLVVSVTFPQPVASFTMSKTKAAMGESITFSNTSQNADTYAWDFGDGNTSTVMQPTHAWNEAGTYTVTLTATGAGGQQSYSRTVEITPPPFNVVPGERIDVFNLGDNVKTHFDKISESSFQHLAIMMTDGSYMHLAKFNNTGIGFFLTTWSVNLYQSDVPYSIYAFSPFKCSTEKGISLGSPMSAVADAYGTPDEIYNGGYYYTATLGIAFWADDTETLVEDIYISAPETLKSTTGNNLRKNMWKMLPMKGVTMQKSSLR